MKSLHVHAALALVVTATASTTYSLANFDPQKLSVVGCYSMLNDELNNWHTWPENSAQLCARNCIKYYNATAVALNGGSCFCGHTIPPKHKLVEDKSCKFKCFQPVDEADAAISCGGEGVKEWLPGVWNKQEYYTVVKTGLEEDVPEGSLTEYDEDGNAVLGSSTSSAVPAPTTAVTGVAATIVSTSAFDGVTPSSSSTGQISGTHSTPVSVGSAPLLNTRSGMMIVFGLVAHVIAL